ncbi:MAG: deoxyribonuclease V [Chloroflexi bacterium]|nr:deoxyribonuclease V [Chloroflexota bacterium]
MKIAPLHGWEIAQRGDWRTAEALQRELAGRVVAAGAIPEAAVRLVAGADVHFVQRPDLAHAVVLVMSYPDLTPVEVQVADVEVRVPYRAGFLSFRELPPLLAAFEQVRQTPDLIIVDGQGVAHPRRLGLASHLGLFLDVPTIGCAKSLLTGRHDPVGPEPGERQPLTDKRTGEVIGAVVRTRRRANPLYLSAGHRIGLDDAVSWVQRCLRGHRLPEPSLQAHKLASARPPTG